MKKKILNIILFSLLFLTFGFNKVETKSIDTFNEFNSCEVSVFEFKEFYFSNNTNYFITDFETTLLDLDESSCHMLIKELRFVENSNVAIPIVGWSIYIYLIQILVVIIILITNSNWFIKSSQIF
jgi:hypothetical protein